MSSNKKHSFKYSDWVPIIVLNLEKRRLGWSPKLKKNVYIDDSTDPDIISELKRVREVDMVIAYDQGDDLTIFIELKESEREGFDLIYSEYLDVGGQILYARQKEGRKIFNIFTLDERFNKAKKLETPEKKSLFEDEMD